MKLTRRSVFGFFPAIGLAPAVAKGAPFFEDTHRYERMWAAWNDGAAEVANLSGLSAFPSEPAFSPGTVLQNKETISFDVKVHTEAAIQALEELNQQIKATELKIVNLTRAFETVRTQIACQDEELIGLA